MGLWFGHGCSGQRMLWEHERDYCFGMDALVSVCSRNTNGIMVWAWMLWSSYALGTRTELWFGHGCSGQRMLWDTNGIMVWAWMLWSAYALGTRTGLWFGHGCSGQRMLWEHDGVMGECPWSPGTWRRWSQTPCLPLKKLYNTPLFIPPI